MNSNRKLTLVTGIAYLVTFATSIPALALKEPYLSGGGSLTTLQWAVALEMVLAVACVTTALAVYPLLRQHGQPLAAGFVASRVLEAATIAVGVMALMTISSLRATGHEQLEPVAVALHDWAFLIGPGLLPALNALLFGTLLIRARVVPPWIPWLGIAGAPLLAASAFGTIFGLFDQVSAIAGAFALPIAAWEAAIGVTMLVWGFREPSGGDFSPSSHPESSLA